MDTNTHLLDDETIEVAAKAWWESHGAEPLWDDLDEIDRDVCRADMRAALSAGLKETK